LRLILREFIEIDLIAQRGQIVHAREQPALGGFDARVRRWRSRGRLGDDRRLLEWLLGLRRRRRWWRRLHHQLHDSFGQRVGVHDLLVPRQKGHEHRDDRERDGEIAQNGAKAPFHFLGRRPRQIIAPVIRREGGGGGALGGICG